MGHARVIAFAGSAGRWVAASWACCGPGAVPAAGEWRCVAWVYRFHGEGGGLFARVWDGPVVGCRWVAGVGASLWVGLPRCPLGASRGGLWSAG